MLKVRLRGEMQEIEDFHKKLAEDYNLLNVSSAYQDRGESKYWRLYIDLDQVNINEDSKIFNKFVLQNKDKVKEIAAYGMDAVFHMTELPKVILIELLRKAITVIRDKDIDEYDESDWKDVMCDHEFIFEDLIKDLLNDIEIGIFEEEKNNG